MKKPFDHTTIVPFTIALFLVLTCSLVPTARGERKDKGIELEIIHPTGIIFQEQGGGKELMRFETDTGAIYYKGRLITTDKELVEALKSLMGSYTCPHCGRSLYEDPDIIKVKRKEPADVPSRPAQRP